MVFHRSEGLMSDVCECVYERVNADMCCGCSWPVNFNKTPHKCIPFTIYVILGVIGS